MPYTLLCRNWYVLSDLYPPIICQSPKLPLYSNQPLSPIIYSLWNLISINLRVFDMRRKLKPFHSPFSSLIYWLLWNQPRPQPDFPVKFSFHVILEKNPKGELFGLKKFCLFWQNLKLWCMLKIPVRYLKFLVELY